MANKTLKIETYLSEVKDEILAEIKSNQKLLLSSNPATGKTTLFANICLENIENNHFNRIIFCAPFIIIQEQFKEKLNGNNLEIDFELNYKSKRNFFLVTINLTTHLLLWIFNSTKESLSLSRSFPPMNLFSLL